MQRQTALFAILCFAAAAGPALAQQDAAPVPVQQSSYHVPIFSNDYLTVLRVYIPGGRTTDYHIHSHDQLCVVVEDYPPEAYSQELGKPPGQPRGAVLGDVSFIGYFGRDYTHRAINPGTLPRHSVCAELEGGDAFGFAPATRDVPGYSPLLDNARLRAWKLSLEPGQDLSTITQGAPGLRIVVRGGEIAEIRADGRERAMMLQPGQFFWQQEGAVRGLRNIGTSTVELVELELK